jgi:Outer membrane protein beta-barrel domain
MTMKKLIFLSVLVSFLAVNTNAQGRNDSTNTNDDEWKWEGFKKQMGIFDENLHKAPTISLDYGLSKINLKDFNRSFAKPNLIELKIGYTTQKAAHIFLLNQNYNYAYLADVTTDLSNSSATVNDLKSQMWRFGFGFSSGYGYKIGSGADITPYYTFGFGWSYLHLKDSFANTNDQKLIDPFNNSFRFGTHMEGGLRVRLIPMLSVEAGYERAIIFRRHLFWKWAGSTLIEVLAQGFMDEFVDQIAKSTPGATPVISFLLKNGLAYGIYELRQSKMNWPFKTDPPLAYDQFKFGVTLTF